MEKNLSNGWGSAIIATPRRKRTKRMEGGKKRGKRKENRNNHCGGGEKKDFLHLGGGLGGSKRSQLKSRYEKGEQRGNLTLSWGDRFYRGRSNPFEMGRKIET